jgi:hypothetical protein
VFKEDDIVWRKMPLNDDVSYYRVTENSIRPDRVSAISLENGTEGIIDTNNLQHYWLQVGDRFIHADDGIMVVITDFKMQVGRFCVDVVYASGTRGTFSISEQFCRSITLL